MTPDELRKVCGIPFSSYHEYAFVFPHQHTPLTTPLVTGPQGGSDG